MSILARSFSCFAFATTVALHATLALAQPSFVFHQPTNQVFSEPGGVTMREPDFVRDGETADLWLKVGPSFSYSTVALYYTTDGTSPAGALGVPSNSSTTVLRNNAGTNPIQFVRNEPNGFGGNDDWWRVTLPSSTHLAGTTIKYRFSAWQTSGGGAPVGSEVIAGGGEFQYGVGMPWPGAGAGQANPQAGYPPVNFWKEEAFIGNTYTAAMLDQNGTWWDMYFPTPGAVQGVGTRNEGYSDGPDTFPGLLSSEKRGQMHLNQAQVGLRVNGLTHWLSNPNAVSFTNVTQQYLNDETNTVRTQQRLVFGGNNISVDQYDFAPAGIAFPDGFNGTGPQRHMLVKRMVLTNNTASAQTVDLYMYLDPALNGGDTYDAMFWDAARGAMTVFDKTRRTVTGTGPFINPPDEYNVSTFGGYEKNIALYLSAAMEVQGTNGGPATDSWRDSSTDQSQGWIGRRVTLQPNVPVEVTFMLAGAHLRPEPISDNIPANDGVYDNEIVPMLNWFYATSMNATQTTTDNYWLSWLNSGTTIDTPDNRYDTLMKRSLLATALHQDAINGSIVAGYHNGAYYYSWPRDGAWAAVTLLRAGHWNEGTNVLRWMRDICYRDVEPSFGNNPITGQPHRGFWKQKYSNDGFTIWGAPQIDGTAVYPWALMWHYNLTGNATYLDSHYASVWDSVAAMTRDSIDSRLRFEEAFNLTYTNNLWEDSYDTFIFSNANIVRGLEDASRIATVLGRPADAANFQNLANIHRSGLNARLDWNGENCDISQLGIVYPFEVLSPTDARSVKVIDRINGVQSDTFGNIQPLVNFNTFFNNGHGWTDLINRYWNDGYWGNPFNSSTPWGAGPWFLSTMWYGMYYAHRQDFTPGTGDIDNHKYRMDRLIETLGPIGLGSEQIAPRGIPGEPGPRGTGSLMYPGQNDFMLQTAWPNAWESMSFFVDSLFGFLDYQPNASANTMKFEPKLPSTWGSMTYKNIRMAPNQLVPAHSVDVTIQRDSEGREIHTFTNNTGFQLSVDTTLRSNPAETVVQVTRNGVSIPYTRDSVTGRISVGPIPLEQGAGATTIIAYDTFGGLNCDSIDFNNDTSVFDPIDIDAFLSVYGEGPCIPETATCNDIDFNNDGSLFDPCDIDAFLLVFSEGPCTLCGV